MHRDSSSLSKLAFFINVVCLLTVSTLVRFINCYNLYNKCSYQNIAINKTGRVYSTGDDLSIPNFQNLTIRSTDFDGKITIFAEESQRYLCFNKRWKLVGWTKFHAPACLFYEEMLDNGYTRFRSVRPPTGKGDEPRYIGFNRQGKPMKDARKRKLKTNMHECLEFLKIGVTEAVDKHNKRVVGPKWNAAPISSSSKSSSKSSFLREVGVNSRTINGSITSISTTTNNPIPVPYVYSRRQHRTKIRHKNHHHQHINDIT